MVQKCRIECSACLAGALMLLVLPLRWILAAAAAAAFHELCHYMALKALGVEILAIYFRGGGIVIETEPMSHRRELICSLAGPAGGLLLLLFARWIPRIAVIALVQSIFNLLPVYPLDGGRALQSVTKMLFSPKTANKICRSARLICTAAIGLLGIYAALVLGFGLLPLIAAAYLCGDFLRKSEDSPAFPLPWRQSGNPHRFPQHRQGILLPLFHYARKCKSKQGSTGK